MAIAPTTGATANTAGSTATVTVTVTVTGLRCVLVFCVTNLTGQTVTSVTDGGGSTYSLLVGPLDDGEKSIEVWCTAVTGSVSGSNVTVNWTAGASGRRGALVEEYSGVVAYGVTGTNTGTGTNPTISLVTQDINNYVFAGFHAKYDPSITATSGTARQTLNAGTNLSAVVIDNTAASPSSVTCTGTQADSLTWQAIGVELRSTLSPRNTNIIHSRAVNRASFF